VNKPPARKRFCVFCGKPPQDKNNEHVLPQWLLELTGDPNRVVQMGHNYEADKPIRFAWDQLVMPACKSCNDDFGRGLESRVKPIMERLVTFAALPVTDYMVLLDWLDKVRIGLWLNYMVIQKFRSGLVPKFHIRDRIGTKDRMVAVYNIGPQPKGLNAIGVESILFHHNPACFSLRVNDLLLLNISGDFLFARQCGFPAPDTVLQIMDGPYAGRMHCENWRTTRKVQRRLFEPRLIKPTVQLYQPIMMTNPAKLGEFLGDPSKDDRFLAQHMANWETGAGVLFRQFDRRVTRLLDLDEPVPFDAVTGKACVPASHLSAQTYDLQCILTERTRWYASNAERYDRWLRRTAEMVRLNRGWAEIYRALNDPVRHEKLRKLAAQFES
jgi:hypothetical protein